MEGKSVVLVVDDVPQNVKLLEAYLFRKVMKLLERQMVKKLWQNLRRVKSI